MANDVGGGGFALSAPSSCFDTTLRPSHRHSKSSSDSKEFEFNGVWVPPLDFEQQPSPADDLFYKGRLLPLYLARSQLAPVHQRKELPDPATVSSSSSSSPFSTSSTSSSGTIGSYTTSSPSEGDGMGSEKRPFFKRAKTHHHVGSWRKLLLLGSRKSCNKVAGLAEEGSLCKSCGQLKPFDTNDEPGRSIGSRTKESWRKYLKVFRPTFYYPSSWSKQQGSSMNDDRVLLDKSSFFSGHLGLPTNKRENSSTAKRVTASPLHHSGLLVSAADVQSAIAYCKQQNRPN